MSLLLVAAAVMASAASAAADSVKLTNGLTYESVTIMGVADGAVRFRMRRGTIISKPIREVAVVRIVADKNFTLGESLLQQGKYTEAEAAYTAARRVARRPWKKTLIDYRLLAVSVSAGWIDKATSRWLKIIDDAEATGGLLALRPKKLAPPRSGANDRAIILLKAKAEKVRGAHLKAVRQLLLDLYERQGRLAEARAIAAQLAGKTTTPETKPSNGQTETPPVGSADVQLRLASLSFKSGRYKQVVEQIKPRLKQFTAVELPSALLLLGRAKLEMGKRESDKPSARKLLTEAGLGLMRVVVFFPGATETPHALFSAGEVNERLGNAAAAKAAYSAVVSRFVKSPAAKEAKKAIERMKKGTRD